MFQKCCTNIQMETAKTIRFRLRGEKITTYKFYETIERKKILFHTQYCLNLCKEIKSQTELIMNKDKSI